MTKHFRSIFSFVMALVMVFSVGTSSYAAEKNEAAVETQAVASSTLISAGGVFSYSKSLGTFTLSSSTSVRCISAFSGGGSVEIVFWQQTGGNNYISKTVTANGSGDSWHLTLPAGKWEVDLFDTSGVTHAYSVSVYTN